MSTINDLPDVILTNIFASITDTRTRNSVSLVCRKFLLLERTTRTSLTLRGNARNLFLIPTCFRSVTELDLSLLSPCGHSLLSSSSSSSSSSPSSDPHLLAHRLRVAFPLVTSLTVCARSPSVLEILLHQWPGLRRVKLVRWHQRPQSVAGADFVPLFEVCKSLTSLDLSSFYYWTEDLPPVMRAYPEISARITDLDLLTVSFIEGFKSYEIKEISAACCNLKRFLVACMFDPRYIGFVGGETLLAIANNCPGLSHLHLADSSSLATTRSDPDDEDARISVTALIEFFSGLPLLEELVLDVCKNVRDGGLAMEILNSKCKRLRVLKLGQFHGICLALGSQLDGVALCGGLESLSIKNSPDLTDMGLIGIGRGCCRLAKFEVQGCNDITMRGVRTMVCLLRKTLVEVKISSCKNLDARASLCAVEPIRDRIERLHIDCVWDGLEESGNSEDAAGYSFDLNEVDNEEPSLVSDDVDFGSEYEEMEEKKKKKKCKYSSEAECSSFVESNGNGFWSKSWDRLRHLSLWICVGEFLTPLPVAGLDDCPNLEEICIKVEGDCRGRHKPSERGRLFGLSCLADYPRLSKMKLDCGDTIGYALTAPPGQMDLSLWERFFLNGIGNLSLNELDYWPPQDRDVNQRSLSLPAVGLLAECLTLRKLFIHGTAHEHFMMFLPKIPNLRDVQLREDYYPAPENDMRVGSCSRFEEALNSRRIDD